MRESSRSGRILLATFCFGAAAFAASSAVADDDSKTDAASRRTELAKQLGSEEATLAGLGDEGVKIVLQRLRDLRQANRDLEARAAPTANSSAGAIPRDRGGIEGISTLMSSVKDDSEVRAALKKWAVARLDADTARNAQEATAYGANSWAYLVNNVVAAVSAVGVHVMVGIGLWAAMKEFKRAARTRRSDPPTTELQISAEGVGVKTVLVGLLILTTSFAFYAAYVKFVLPVQAS